MNHHVNSANELRHYCYLRTPVQGIKSYVVYTNELHRAQASGMI